MVTDASGHVVTCFPARSCGGGGNQARGDLLDAESCGGGSSQARGDLRITTGSELWSSAGPAKVRPTTLQRQRVYDRLVLVLLY